MAGQASILTLLTGLLTTFSPHGLGDWCPGLVRKPEPRQEPWNIEWAKELAREVREADAGEASRPQPRSVAIEQYKSSTLQAFRH